jgi:hypothetical protein
MVSMLAVAAQWGILANAQPQTGAMPAWPTATSGYLAHPPTNRLFFFLSDPMNIGRPAVFGQPAKAPGTGGFLRPYSITALAPRNPAHPTLKFRSMGLLPLESPRPQDLRLLRPKNSRLFFFSKP